MTTLFLRLASTVALLSFITCRSTEAAGLKYDVRVAASSGGGKFARITNVGEAVNLELWAVVTGAGPGAEGFLYGYGSLLSGVSAGTEIRGDLSATVTAPFADMGSSSNGAKVDLDGDGVAGQEDLDVGNGASASNSNFLKPSANVIVTTPTAPENVPGEFKLATFTFTVTGITLAPESQTLINFRPASFTGVSDFSASWQQDGIAFTSRTAGASITFGAPVVISTIPEPSSLLLLGAGALGCGSFRRRRR